MNQQRNPTPMWAIVAAVVLVVVVTYLRNRGQNSEANPTPEVAATKSIPNPPKPPPKPPAPSQTEEKTKAPADSPRTETSASSPPTKSTETKEKENRSQTTAARVPGGGLAAHERAGGHTLARHVGKTEADLRERLSEQADISAASTFYNRDIAETVIAAALAAHQRKIDNWLKNSGDSRMPPLEYRYTERVGISLRRGSSSIQHVSSIRIILQRDREMPLGYLIITAYPQT